MNSDLIKEARELLAAEYAASDVIQANVRNGRHDDAPYFAAIVAALASQQAARGRDEPMGSQPGKRVSILEVAAGGKDRRFDPVAADSELASVPLIPLWQLPELHPRNVAAECLSTMESARQSTRNGTANRVRLTDTIALVRRFIGDMERSERFGDYTRPAADAAPEDVRRGLTAEIENNARHMFTQQADKYAVAWEHQWEPTKNYWRQKAIDAASQKEKKQ